MAQRNHICQAVNAQTLLVSRRFGLFLLGFDKTCLLTLLLFYVLYISDLQNLSALTFSLQIQICLHSKCLANTVICSAPVISLLSYLTPVSRQNEE